MSDNKKKQKRPLDNVEEATIFEEFNLKKVIKLQQDIFDEVKKYSFLIQVVIERLCYEIVFDQTYTMKIETENTNVLVKQITMVEKGDRESPKPKFEAEFQLSSLSFDTDHHIGQLIFKKAEAYFETKKLDWQKFKFFISAVEIRSKGYGEILRKIDQKSEKKVVDIDVTNCPQTDCEFWKPKVKCEIAIDSLQFLYYSLYMKQIMKFVNCVSLLIGENRALEISRELKKKPLLIFQD
jgi:hypothetical protein